jgi:hypothetical protein
MDNDNALPTPPSVTPTIRTVDVGRSVEWLAGGFRMFMKVPGTWVIITLALLIGSWMLNFILPRILSGPLTTIITVVVVGALMRACQALEEGRDIASSAQAAASYAPLWILGVIAAAMSFGLVLLTILFGLSSFAVGSLSSASMFPMIGFGALILFVAVVVMYMALWLAPALVVLKGINPVEAIKLSLQASLKNLVAYIIVSLLALLLCIIGAIPYGLGLLVVIPMLVCANYLAYKDIFGA